MDVPGREGHRTQGEQEPEKSWGQAQLKQTDLKSGCPVEVWFRPRASPPPLVPTSPRNPGEAQGFDENTSIFLEGIIQALNPRIH